MPAMDVVIVQGSCGPSVTNSAFLFVNTPVNQLRSPVRYTAQGIQLHLKPLHLEAGLLLMSGAKTASLCQAPKIQASLCEIYGTMKRDLQCGSERFVRHRQQCRFTYSQCLDERCLPLSSVTKNLGSDIVFATLASGVGPFTYVWKLNRGHHSWGHF